MRRIALCLALAVCVLATIAPTASAQRGVSAGRSARSSSSGSYGGSRSYGGYGYSRSNYWGYSTYRPYSSHRYTDADWIFLAVCFLGVPLTVAIFLAVRWQIQNRTVGYVRIIATPRGEAPSEVRDAWVGAVLPLRSGETQPMDVKSGSLLTPGGPILDHGYVVAGPSAIRALEAHAPAAAAWWRTNAAHVLSSGYRLVFPEEVCERVP